MNVLLNLRHPEVTRLVELLRNLDCIPVDGEQTVRVDDALVRELFTNPGSLMSIYRKGPQRFRQMISDDESARDVIAVSHHRSQVQKFRRLLDDDEYPDAEVSQAPGRRREAVWQRFFEDNPWILGVPLTGQLLTSWSNQRLEQVVAGASIAGVGKRTDALLRTSGRIKSMVFAEIKTHRTELLANSECRPGCWAPSDKLSGGVAQVQGTVHRAVTQIGDRLQDINDDALMCRENSPICCGHGRFSSSATWASCEERPVATTATASGPLNCTAGNCTNQKSYLRRVPRPCRMAHHRSRQRER